MDNKEHEIELGVECAHCGTVNYVYLNEDDFDTVDELSIGIEDTVCTDDMVDFIFWELTKDGIVTNASGIRAVLRYFRQFCLNNMTTEDEDV